MQAIKNWLVDSLANLARIILSRDDIRSLVETVTQEDFDRKLLNALDNEKVRKKLWVQTNIRPDTPDCHWASYPNSIYEQRMRVATEQAVDFVEQNMATLNGKNSPFELLEYCLSRTRVDGLICEFGVYTGTTINHIADLVPDKIVHGFDSFEGLPEDWGPAPKGLFATHGQLPEVRSNVRLHQGWFDETLPGFMEKHTAPVSFVHIDSDLYSSAKTVLDSFSSRFVDGSIIVFDEYFNYPHWKDHEYKAFMEFVSDHNVDFEYIAYTNRGYSVGVLINKIDT